jgi:hypothetical protein
MTKKCLICGGVYSSSFYRKYNLFGFELKSFRCEGCEIQFARARDRLLRKIVMFFYDLDDTDPLPWDKEFWWYHPKPWEKEFWRND